MLTYQFKLKEIQQTAETINCLVTEFFMVKGNEVVIHSGIYDGESISYCTIQTKLLKYDSWRDFIPVRHYIKTITGDFCICEEVEMYSRSTKSLTALIRKHLKESV